MQSVLRHSGLPPVLPLSYLQREYGWVELASLDPASAAPERSQTLPELRVLLMGDKNVGRHALVEVSGGFWEV